MKTKVLHWLWLLAIATFFAGLFCQINATDYEIYGPGNHASNITASAGEHATETVGEPEWREITAETTRYSKWETCWNRECITASGTIATAGRTIACPRSIKHGTIVEIEGHRYTCEDRTSKKYDGRFDIYQGDTEADYYEALRIGKKRLTIKIYE